MSYSDDHKDMQLEAFLRKWTPNGIEPMKLTEENYRWTLARLRATEDELKRLKDAIGVLTEAVR